MTADQRDALSQETLRLIMQMLDRAWEDRLAAADDRQQMRELLQEYQTRLLADAIGEVVEKEHARLKADPKFSLFQPPQPVAKKSWN